MSVEKYHVTGATSIKEPGLLRSKLLNTTTPPAGPRSPARQTPPSAHVRVFGGTVVGATVVGGTVVGGTVVGATVVGATVVGATVVGGTVVGGTVVGGTVVGGTVVGATVVGATVVGATVVGGTVAVAVGATVVDDEEAVGDAASVVVISVRVVVASETVVDVISAAGASPGSGANLTTNTDGNVVVVVVPTIGPVPSPDAISPPPESGGRAIAAGIDTPTSSSAPTAVEAAPSSVVATEPGRGAVSAHLRDFEDLPPEHTDKIPFWYRVEPSLTHRQFLIAATP